MQNDIIKKLSLFVLFFSLYSQALYAQNYKQQIQQADLLFEKQHYTEALQAYENLLSRSGQASPEMLLKMAYIEEGLQNYTKALYYLNLYYLYKPNQQVIERMKEIALQHHLQGYEFKDVDFFMILYERYYLYISLLLLSVCFISFTSLIMKRIRREHIPGRHSMAFLLFLLVVFLFLNIRKNSAKAIVAQDNVYLMNAPSAGASLVTVLGRGHRLDVKNQQDIWLEIVWNNQIAFVRKQNVLLIQ